MPRGLEGAGAPQRRAPLRASPSHSQRLLPPLQAGQTVRVGPRDAGMALTPSLAAEANLLAPVVRLLQPWKEAEATVRPRQGHTERPRSLSAPVAPHHPPPEEA